MDEPKGLIERAGIYVGIAGVGLLAAMFLVVLVNGTWPPSLGSVRALFSFLGDTVGGWAIVIEFWIFAGPGVLIYWVGRLFNRAKSARSLPSQP